MPTNSLCTLFLSPLLCFQLLGNDSPLAQNDLPLIQNDSPLVQNDLTVQNELPLVQNDSPLVQSDLTVQNDLSVTQSEEKKCDKGLRPIYVTMRHIEANGIGYNQGYTTLEGFFHTADPNKWVPFLDLRGHLFNNGKPAVNAGFGLRRLGSSRIWGINGYYDYRKTDHQRYNQVSAGLESLGRVWDFRINGYLPIGKKSSHRYDPRFEEFKGHYAYISRKFEFAMKGANAEIGVHMNYNNFPLYFAVGPYYLEGEGKVAWGGEGRIALDIWDYIRLEASTSYDNVFKWIGQGQISLMIPLGKREIIKPKRGRSCKEQWNIAKRAVQRVDRMEIIPVDKKHVRSRAIDPVTGQPYFFWFVNSGGHSDGSFESPFPTLDSAQFASHPNDVIYVYPGNYDTSTIIGNTLTLQDNQKLFGAGIDQSLKTTAGRIAIPAMASGLPIISNSTPNFVITCGNNNEISGFDIMSSGGVAGIGCSIIVNTYIHNNIFELNDAGGVGIVGSAGQITILDNQFNLNASTTVIGGIEIVSGSSANFLIARNSFTNFVSGGGQFTGIGFLSTNSFGTLTIQNNQFTRISTNSITVGLSGNGISSSSATGTAVINGNAFYQSNIPSGIGDIDIISENGASLVTQLIGNVWVNTATPSQPAILIRTADSLSSICATLNRNVSDSNPAYELDNNGGEFIADINNNDGTFITSGSIEFGACP